MVSIGHSSCTWPNKKQNKYMIINNQNNFLHILVCFVLLHGHYIKAYRFKYKCIFAKNPIIF